MMGAIEPALQSLQSAADDGFPCYPQLKGDQQLDALRGDPRFVALMDKLRRDWEQRGRTL